MAGTPAHGVHRPRTGGPGLVGPVVALAASAVLSVLLLALAVPQLAATARQAGRPGTDAVVIACPPSGGSRGLCSVRVARGGHDVVPLEHAALLFPEPGDALPVVIEQARSADGTPYAVAEPAGWRPWAVSGALLFAMLVTVRMALSWGRRVLDRVAREVPDGAAHPGRQRGRSRPAGGSQPEIDRTS